MAVGLYFISICLSIYIYMDMAWAKKQAHVESQGSKKIFLFLFHMVKNHAHDQMYCTSNHLSHTKRNIIL